MSPRRKLVVAGTVLLALWAAWWTIALARLELPGAEHTWMKVPAFGADFWSQTDYAARRWASGIDPYANERHLFHYPPLVLHLFAWTPALGTVLAMRIWIVAIGAITTAGTWAAWRARRAFGMDETPFTLVLAAVLFSFPVVYALERANFDLLTLLAILFALWIRRAKSQWADVLAGILLGFAPWVKIYPGLIVIGLLALRWWVVLGAFVFQCVNIGLADREGAIRSFKLLGLAVQRVGVRSAHDPFPTWSHSVSSALAKVTGGAQASSLAALVLLSPLLGWVCLRVWRSARRDEVAYPLLLWIVALASFVPQIANDYSLVFLPLAAVAVWSPRDPQPIRAGMMLLGVGWEPLAFPMNGLLLLSFKLAGLAAVGMSLVRRGEEIEPRTG